MRPRTLRINSTDNQRNTDTTRRRKLLRWRRTRLLPLLRQRPQRVQPSRIHDHMGTRTKHVHTEHPDNPLQPPTSTTTASNHQLRHLANHLDARPDSQLHRVSNRRDSSLHFHLDVRRRWIGLRTQRNPHLYNRWILPLVPHRQRLGDTTPHSLHCNVLPSPANITPHSQFHLFTNQPNGRPNGHIHRDSEWRILALQLQLELRGRCNRNEQRHITHLHIIRNLQCYSINYRL